MYSTLCTLLRGAAGNHARIIYKFTTVQAARQQRHRHGHNLQVPPRFAQELANKAVGSKEARHRTLTKAFATFETEKPLGIAKVLGNPSRSLQRLGVRTPTKQPGRQASFPLPGAARRITGEARCIRRGLKAPLPHLYCALSHPCSSLQSTVSARLDKQSPRAEPYQRLPKAWPELSQASLLAFSPLVQKHQGSDEAKRWLSRGRWRSESRAEPANGPPHTHGERPGPCWPRALC